MNFIIVIWSVIFFLFSIFVYHHNTNFLYGVEKHNEIKNISKYNNSFAKFQAIDNISTNNFNNKIGISNHIRINNNFNKDMNNNNLTERGIWIYTNNFKYGIPSSFVDKILGLDLNTIYFAGTTTNDWKSQEKYKNYTGFIDYAHSKGINVYAVTLEDPQFVFKSESELIREFSDFINQTDKIFNTYMVDVEPHTLPNADPNIFLPKYIQMSFILEEISHYFNVKYIDTVPIWYHFAIKNLGISSGLNVLSGDKINLMDYAFFASQILENVKKIKSQIEKPYVISINVSPGYGAPFLNDKNIKETVNSLNRSKLSFGLYEAQYILNQNSRAFY